MDNKVEGYSEQRKYIGQEFDVDTGLNYLNARYYNAELARFISQDPVALNTPEKLLEDPQQLNFYSYARNNPITGSDPSGLLSIIIPGTWYENGWENSSQGKSFQNKVAEQFGETPVPITNKSYWPGGDNALSRTQASDNIINLINNHPFEDGEKLNIIGHSHGGNIAFDVSNKIDKKIDTLITLGTPIRYDYTPNKENIGTFINAYSSLDLVQVNGGGEHTTTGLLGSVIFGEKGGKIGDNIGWGQFGSAQRTIDGANNINVTWQASWLPWSVHSSFLNNSSVWNKITDALPKKK